MEESSIRKTHDLKESAAMKKMLAIAERLYTNCPHAFDKNKDQSFLLKEAIKGSTQQGQPDGKGGFLPPIGGNSLAAPARAYVPDKTPKFIQEEYENLHREFEAENKRNEDLKKEKNAKLKKYIFKEQEYREKIEEYTKKIK